MMFWKMCSTPFGIFEFFTLRSVPQCWGTGKRAQRLSASSNSSLQNTSRTRQLFRIVLNAFRHLRILHLDHDHDLDAIAQMCSTPFGIFEFFTMGRMRPMRRRQCAQRLSASSNSSHEQPVGGHGHRLSAQRLSASSNSSPSDFLGSLMARLCSTPFGIFEFFTVTPSGAQTPLATCSTPFGIFEFFTRWDLFRFYGVNVLNAFRHLRILHEFIRRRGNSVRSAQRLSASSNSSHLRRFEGVATGNVLNAFRHLRILHWLPPCSMGFSPCAQRLSASSNSSQGWNVITYGGRMMCSTPFGIFEFFTTDVDQRDSFCCVLNAFRHLRILHQFLTSRQKLPSSAQRLSASSNSSHRRQFELRRWRACAQRLSASSNSSLLAGRHCHAALECSTPFGIFEFFTRCSKSSQSPPTTCSTPFGIFEFFTTKGVTCFKLRSCAQRLSASSNSSLVPICRSRSRGRAQRLSASSNSSLLSITDTRPSHGCAQRLSASSNSSPSMTSNEIRVCSGAQRLSASSNSSPVAIPAKQGVIHVLNAFRHLRILH